jgi:protein TonB
MKLALFFSLSLATHGAALLIPVSSNRQAPDRAIVVTILPTPATRAGDEKHLAPEPGGGRSVRRKTDRAADLIKHFVNENQATAPSVRETIAAPSRVSVIATTSDSDIALTALELASETIESGGWSGGAGNGSNSASAGATKALGVGAGNGERTRTPIGLRYAPMPRYPQRARQKGGKEGKVTLRVVVDVEGQTKAVDIMASSGDETLDQVARDTVKTWRFVPARYGNRPVEGWVDVPIVFRLNDTNN